MTSHKVKLFSAVIAAVTLVATVAVAHNFYSRNAQAAAESAMAAKRHGNVSCGLANEADCQSLQTNLPM